VPSPAHTGVALLSLYGSDRTAAALLLTRLPREELDTVCFWLVRELAQRCGWSDAMFQAVLLREAAAA
jgi:hypothetical protein